MFCNTSIDWSATGSMLSAMAAIFAVFIALYQFKKINKSLSDSNVMKIMEIEFEINRRLERASDLRKEILEISPKSSNNFSNDQLIEIENKNLFYKAAYESYLNSLDRLSSFILKGIYNESDFKEDYQETLKSIISMPEFRNDYNGEKNYKSIIKLNTKWQAK